MLGCCRRLGPPANRCKCDTRPYRSLQPSAAAVVQRRLNKIQSGHQCANHPHLSLCRVRQQLQRLQQALVHQVQNDDVKGPRGLHRGKGRCKQ